MWKLETKERISTYVNIFYFYHSIVQLIVPFVLAAVLEMNGRLYILGYGLIYLLGFYLMSWIMVPVLLFCYDFLFSKLGLIKSSVFLLLLLCTLSIWGYSFFNFDTNDDSRFMVGVSTSPLFLWVLYLIKEDPQSS